MVKSTNVIHFKNMNKEKISNSKLARGYENSYELFDSSLMRLIRAEALDEDIGQHSWITGAELRSYLLWLDLSDTQTILDFGCGPGGPLTFLVRETGARAVGIDLSTSALSAARHRAEEMNLTEKIELCEVDGNQGMSSMANTFDAVVSFDVILHLQDRHTVLSDWKQILQPGGKLLFTDAGVVTGPVSNQEFYLRSINGYTQFVPDGFNESALEEVGFTLESKEDQSHGAIANPSGRIQARKKYKDELVEIEGLVKFDQEQKYLETMVDLYKSKALTRFAYRAVLNSE